MKNVFPQKKNISEKGGIVLNFCKFLQSALIEDGLILISASAFDRLLYIALVEDEKIWPYKNIIAKLLKIL